MADVQNSAGKKTWFGRDKGQENYAKFLRALKVTVQCMVLDNVIRESTPTPQVVEELEERLQQFQMAFPPWQDAYGFATLFFGENCKDAIATIERLRSAP